MPSDLAKGHSFLEMVAYPFQNMQARQNKIKNWQAFSLNAFYMALFIIIGTSGMAQAIYLEDMACKQDYKKRLC